MYLFVSHLPLALCIEGITKYFDLFDESHCCFALFMKVASPKSQPDS